MLDILSFFLFINELISSASLIERPELISCSIICVNSKTFFSFFLILDLDDLLRTCVISKGINEEFKKELEISSMEAPSLIIVEILPVLSETIHL